MGGPRPRGKKRCELGEKCPYKHEHQHLGEYFHDGDADAPGGAAGGGRGAGRGQRLGSRLAPRGRARAPTDGGNVLGNGRTAENASEMNVAAKRKGAAENKRAQEPGGGAPAAPVRAPAAPARAPRAARETIEIDDSDDGAAVPPAKRPAPAGRDAPIEIQSSDDEGYGADGQLQADMDFARRLAAEDETQAARDADLARQLAADDRAADDRAADDAGRGARWYSDAKQFSDDDDFFGARDPGASRRGGYAPLRRFHPGALGGDDVERALRASAKETIAVEHALKASANETIAIDKCIVADQDADYEASLAADRAKVAKKKVSDEADAAQLKRAKQEATYMEAELAASQESAEEDSERRLDSKRRKLAERGAEPPPGAGTTVRFKLPAGRQFERRFDSAATVRDLCDFVEVTAGTPAHFDLVGPFPRRRLAVETATLADMDFHTATLILVVDLDG